MMNLLGVVLVPLIDLLNRRIKDSDLRFWVSVLICSLVGVFVNFVTNNGFHFQTMLEGAESISSSILVIFGIAQLVYKGVYEDSRVQSLIRGQGKQP